MRGTQQRNQPREKAVAWLRNELKDGPRRGAELVACWQGARATLYRAATDIGVASDRSDGTWSLEAGSSVDDIAEVLEVLRAASGPVTASMIAVASRLPLDRVQAALTDLEVDKAASVVGWYLR